MESFGIEGERDDLKLGQRGGSAKLSSSMEAAAEILSDGGGEEQLFQTLKNSMPALGKSDEGINNHH